MLMVVVGGEPWIAAHMMATHPGPAQGRRGRLVPRGKKQSLSSLARRTVPDARNARRGRVRGRFVLALVAAAVILGIGAAQAAAAPGSSAFPGGVPVELIAGGENPSIVVGDPNEPGATHTYAAGPGELQVLVLDRETLEPSADVAQANTSYSLANDQPGISAALAGADSSDLVLVNGPSIDAPAPIDGVTEAAVDGLLSSIGLEGLAVNLQFGDWSGIGVPGTAVGTGYQFQGGRQAAGMLPGSIRGRLRPDSEGNYAFAWPSGFVSFDTYAQGAGLRTSAIEVDGHTYSSETLAPGETGWHLVVLDGRSLQPVGNYTFHDGSGGPQEALVRIEELSKIATPVILLRSIGRPSDLNLGEPAASEDWGTLAEVLAGYGGNAGVVLAMKGDGDYALVGRRGMSEEEGANSGAELNQGLVGAKSPRAVGTLERNHQGLWGPAESKRLEPGVALAGALPGIQRVLAQPAEPFPAFTGAGAKEAEAFIATSLGLSDKGTYGIRTNYWADENIEWDQLAATLRAQSPCAAEPCAAAYPAVRAQLVDEFDKVQTVREYFTGGGTFDLTGILNTVFTIDNQSAFNSVDSAIVGALDETPSGTAGGENPLEVLGAVSDLAGSVTDDDPAAAAGFAVVEGLADLLGPSLNNADGSPVFGGATFRVDSNALAGQVGTMYSTAIERLDLVSNLLVGEWGTLQAAYESINTSLSGETSFGAPGWGFDDETRGALTARLTRSMYSYVWQALFPLTTIAHSCTPPLGWHRFIDGEQTWKYPILSPGSVGDDYTLRPGDLTLATSSGGGKQTEWSYPSPSIISTLFDPWSPSDPSGPLGLQPLYTVTPSTQPEEAPPGFHFDYGMLVQQEPEYFCGGDAWTRPEEAGAQSPSAAAVSPPAKPAPKPKTTVQVKKISLDAALKRGILVRVANVEQGTAVRMHAGAAAVKGARSSRATKARPVEIARGRKRTTRAVETVRVRFHPWALKALSRTMPRALRVWVSVDGYPTKRRLVLTRAH
jgi:hypothetical protein